MEQAIIASDGKLFTLNAISARLNCTLMTLSTWRRGTSNRRLLPMRTVRCGFAHRVLVAENDLLTWLAAYRPDLYRMWTDHDEQAELN